MFSAIQPRTDCQWAAIPGRVSVIVPTYNRAALVEETLASIAAQTWPDIETIVVDDGSTDDTLERLEQWRSTHAGQLLTIVSQPNAGPAAARNRGLAAARGEFIYYIDSDDLIEPHAIATLAHEAARTGAAYAVAHVRNTDLACRPLAGDSEGISVVDQDDYFASRWMTHAVLYRRQTLARVGAFDEELRRGEDTEHAWRVIATCGAGAVVPVFIGVRRIHDYGHLSVGRNVSQTARDDLRTVSRFVAWAQAASVFDRRIARIALRRALLAAIRSGYSGDWDTNRQAAALARAMHPHHRSLSRWLCPLLERRTRLVYAPLLWSLSSLKWIRNRIRFVAGRTGSLWPRRACRYFGLSAPLSPGGSHA